MRIILEKSNRTFGADVTMPYGGCVPSAVGGMDSFRDGLIALPRWSPRRRLLIQHSKRPRECRILLETNRRDTDFYVNFNIYCRGLCHSVLTASGSCRVRQCEDRNKAYRTVKNVKKILLRGLACDFHT